MKKAIAFVLFLTLGVAAITPLAAQSVSDRDIKLQKQQEKARKKRDEEQQKQQKKRLKAEKKRMQEERKKQQAIHTQ